MKEMELLCLDLERHIASFCDHWTLDSLSNVSKGWRHAVETAPVNIEGPINGDTFSFFTASRFGPVYMPFVNTIVLEYRFSEAPKNLLECLAALKLHTFKKRKLALHISSAVLDAFGPQLHAFLATISWASISALDHVSIHLRAHTAHLSSYSWSQSTLVGLKKLFLIDMIKNEDLSVICVRKAFLAPELEHLCLYGVLTDTAMLDLPRSTSLKDLECHYEGVCTWTNIRPLQLACPELRSFSIISSNLLKVHLDLFCWSLWPYLKRLNVEQNYTLNLNNGPIHWPPSLTELFVAYTNITGPSFMPLGLTKISCNLELTDLWLKYLTSNALTSISATMKHYIKNSSIESSFWSLVHQNGHLQRLAVHHMEFFRQDELINNIKSTINNTLVLKRKPLDLPC